VRASTRTEQDRANNQEQLSTNGQDRLTSMNGEVQAHQLDKLGVTETKHVREVGRPVHVAVDGGYVPVGVNVAVDRCGDSG